MWICVTAAGGMSSDTGLGSPKYLLSCPTYSKRTTGGSTQVSRLIVGKIRGSLRLGG